MKRNEDELNRPVYRQALAHSCLLLRFLSTGGEANDSKKNPLWLLVSGIIFHLCPHGSHAWGARGLRLGCSMFGFFPRSAASCAERERERRQQTMSQLANMSRQQQAARHRRVEAEVVASDASS